MSETNALLPVDQPQTQRGTSEAELLKHAPTQDTAQLPSTPSQGLEPPLTSATVSSNTTEITEEKSVTSAKDTSQSSTMAKNTSPDQEVDTSSEPQNPLTSLFTPSEWTALKGFRTELPDIFAEGYPDNPDARNKAIVLWGVTIDPAVTTDARVSVVLMKFLRARNLNVKEARQMMIATLRWRDQFNIDAAMKEEFPEDIFGKLGHVFGRDRDGRPVIYNLYGANKDVKAVFADVPRFLRWRVALMEKSIAELDFREVDQTVQIHDYEGVSITSRDANSKNAASEASSIFQNHYPELLFKKFFVNVPALMNWIFWVFKPIISAKTLEKMSVVGSGHYALSKALLPVIDAKELPKRYGGEADAF